MHIVSVNIGRPKMISGGRSPYHSGIDKTPSSAPVRIGLQGLAGDAVCNRTQHGGPDQAVYLYSADDYAWWEKFLGQAVPFGTFGDNLTLSDFDSARATIGDRLHCGDVTLEVSSPRIPCATLSRHMGDPGFLKKFRAAERPGAYCRVVHEGLVKAGDPLRYQAFRGDAVTILDLYRQYFEPIDDADLLRRQLAAPLAIRLRAAKEKHLETLERNQCG